MSAIRSTRMPWGIVPAVLAAALVFSACKRDEDPTDTDTDTDTDVEEISLTEVEWATATQVYFDRCAGCHGAMRTGATGPTLEPEPMKAIGTAALEALLTYGSDGGMPPFGEQGILDADEINILARFLQLPPPEPPPRPMEDIVGSWELHIPTADRPTEPVTTRDWENFFGVILRDSGQVAIMDGTTLELVKVLDTGFAVHILRSSSDGRYFYSIGRDGRMTLIDLWMAEPTTVAEVQGCSDARSVDGSKFPGYENQYVIKGCYWPPQYVVHDGETLEPLHLVDLPMTILDTAEEVIENRVAAIVASHDDPVWVVNLKETGHVAIVDYSQPGFPITSAISSARFLHDGGWDHSGRYFMTAANMSNTMVVIDVQEQKLEAMFETGTIPHPGRGANWYDPTLGWVNTTTHIGEGLMTIYGTDPLDRPENAWKVLREVSVPTGGLFVKTHPNSKWVWVDSPLNSDMDKARSICVYSKESGELHDCWVAADRGLVTHFEYNREGTQIWASVWDPDGELIVYDDETLAEVKRFSGDWLVTPTGKFNVYNTSRDIY